MVDKKYPGSSDETYIIPGNSATPPGGARPTPAAPSSAPTEIMPAGRTGYAQQVPTDRFVDPFETVLLPTEQRGGGGGSNDHFQLQGQGHMGSSPSDTVVLRPDHPPGGAAAGQMNVKPSTNPIVGLLLVVGGPGKGAFRPLFYGNNTIGRDAGQMVPLNFGDETISATEQAYIRYDHEDRKFLFIPNLSKTNVVAVNDDKPTIAIELKNWDMIRIGQTHLRFMAVCGQHFDWGDVADA